MWAGFSEAVVELVLDTGRVLLEPRPAGVVAAFPLDDPVHIVTAFNPAGVAATLEQNLAAHGRLRTALGSAVRFETVGSAPDGGFAEPGFAFVAAESEALAIGEQFGQAAIYRWSADALTILGVDESGRRHRLGWALSDRVVTHRF